MLYYLINAPNISIWDVLARRRVGVAPNTGQPHKLWLVYPIAERTSKLTEFHTPTRSQIHIAALDRIWEARSWSLCGGTKVVN